MSGLLLLLNKKCTGGLFLTVAVAFILIVKDNPWLRHSALKTTTKEINERITDFLKNLGIMGAAILLMIDKSISY